MIPDRNKSNTVAHTPGETAAERIRWAREGAVHAGLYGATSYIGRPEDPSIVSMFAALLQLHREGTLSEGQVSRATCLDRVTIRKFCDAMEVREEAARSAIQRAGGEQ